MNSPYLDILKQYWGYDAFRPLQQEAILSVGAGRDTLVLLPTGGGKSIIYQVPALAKEGVCIVITPLISLMKDQVDRLKKGRILAEAIHSGVSARDIDRILDNCIYGDVKFLYISPERIDNTLFQTRFSKMEVSLIAVDEAHCISQWGYDFRPSYLRITRLRELQPEVPFLALTASATPDVCREIMHHLKFHQPQLFQSTFARKNLVYVVRHTEDKIEHLLRVVRNVQGSGIVYVRTRENTEKVAELLRASGITAQSYHGGMGYLTRSTKQEEWMQGHTQVMVATNAFGMGIDKADVRFVVHHDMPDSMEAYYQEAGRAGRDAQTAYAVLLYSNNDAPRATRRMEIEFPPIDTIKEVYEGLFNLLQIGIGEGKGRALQFNPYDLSGQLKKFTPTVVSALKILQLNDLLVLTDEVDNPTRIHFIVRRDDLYRIRVMRKELDHLLTVILRQYSGLFTDFVPINEAHLAHTSGYTIEHIGELFKTLWQLHIIKYIPGSRSPMLLLTEERLPTADVRISTESYALRKKIAIARQEVIFRYATNSTECRSLLIQRYFGEKSNAPCGVCDYCLSHRKQLPTNNPSTLSQEILTRLSHGPLDVKTLTRGIRHPLDQVLNSVSDLLAEGKIMEIDGGKMQING